MLKQRLITAGILIPLVIWGVLGLPTRGVAAILAIIVALGAWEWTRLSGLTALPARIAYVGLILAAMGAVTAFPGLRLPVVVIGAVWWLAACAWIIRYNRAPQAQPAALWINGVSGLCVLVPAWTGLVILHGAPDYGPGLMLFLMVMVWLADTGAYFAGRRFGRHKLAPHVSPGKTLEGALGALATTLIVGVAITMEQQFALPLAAGFVLLCVSTVILSIVGDLFESLFKRRAGVKDSGTLLPGHGGILDRIDSLTAAAPVFAVGLTILGMLR